VIQALDAENVANLTEKRRSNFGHDVGMINNTMDQPTERGVELPGR
jgi:hypothetical protein